MTIPQSEAFEDADICRAGHRIDQPKDFQVPYLEIIAIDAEKAGIDHRHPYDIVCMTKEQVGSL